jgi:hypothetical protein
MDTLLLEPAPTAPAAALASDCEFVHGALAVFPADPAPASILRSPITAGVSAPA